MATYYKWRKSTVWYKENSEQKPFPEPILPNSDEILVLNSKPSIVNSEYSNRYYYNFNNAVRTEVGRLTDLSGKYWCGSFDDDPDPQPYGYRRWMFYGGDASLYNSGVTGETWVEAGGSDRIKYTISPAPGEFVEYVYSTNQSAYPNGGVAGDYYYDQRTSITSPTVPTGLTYPNTIITSSATVSWVASVTNVPIYAVSTYEVSYSTNGGSTWTVAGTTADTSLSVDLPTGATSIQFRVRAQDSNGQWSSYATGTTSTVLLPPTISVPVQAMQGQNIPVSWTAVDEATSYTLQRKANTDTDWVEVYTGQDLEFTEEVGAWSTVQYRVQAIFSSSPGGWGTSKVIPVVSASALVISGQDGDLGTLTADVPYTVSTDTGKPITVERKVNGQVVASIEASSNFAYDIPIYDLPTGAGTITLTCSVTPEGQAPVQAERKWTYYKAPVLFPQTGSTVQIIKEGKNVYPLTIAEAVRTPQYMGGSLDKTLELLEEILNTAVISVGTYVGTGTSGQSAPNRLRFMSPPTVVTVYGEGRVLSISNTEPTGGQTDAYIQGNEAIWYNISADKQLNESGKTYTYFAAGKRV